MDELIINSKSADKTMDFAKKFAKYIKNGDIIILEGELGAGKTKFVEGFLKYYKLEDEISSPTFTIINEYVSNDINIFHFDVYRLEEKSEFYEIGGEEYFDKGICLIEWGERIEDLLPKEHLKIKFEKDLINGDERKLKIIAFGEKYKTLLEKIKEEIK